MKLIFEKSVPGRHLSLLPPCDVDMVNVPEGLERQTPPGLPELSETDLSRHYTELSHRGERRVLPLRFLYHEI